MTFNNNEEMNIAWQLVSQTDTSLFLTGKAGTGKTTFLRRLKDSLPKRMIVLAPTGVAAINAHGQTIHSFFQLPLSPFVPGYVQEERRTFYRMSDEKKRMMRSLDLLIIDEISMVRADLLDAVDMELRKYRIHDMPFGGVQLLMIGDLCQLAPVINSEDWKLLSQHYETPYFFSSKALQKVYYTTIELQTVYRQEDETFVSLLGKIRQNNIDQSVIDSLNSRYIPHFEPSERQDWILLTTHNLTAQNYNRQRLDAIETTEHLFRAEVNGTFPEMSYPTDIELMLKVGAQVMFIKNDNSSEHAFYNGRIGVVCGIASDRISVFCKGDTKPIIVERMLWENTKYVVDATTKDIKETVEGTFSQFPLRLAWAITVHKSQGLTFDHAVLDINNSFAHGQVYVALSRCRTLEGLVLSNPIKKHSVITDTQIDRYYENRISSSEQISQGLHKLVYAYFKKLLDEMFDFSGLVDDFVTYYKVFGRYFMGDYPDAYSHLQKCLPILLDDIQAVAERFKIQYDSICERSDKERIQDNKLLQERIGKAAVYFSGKLRDSLQPILSSADITVSDKSQMKRYNNALSALDLSYQAKLAVLDHTILEGFSVSGYLKQKGRAFTSGDITKKAKHTTQRRRKRKTSD